MAKRRNSTKTKVQRAPQKKKKARVRSAKAKPRAKSKKQMNFDDRTPAGKKRAKAPPKRNDFSQAGGFPGV